MSTGVHLPLLDRITVASPCSASWDAMAGDERKRHCAQCDLDVHNIAALTREEAEEVLRGLAKGRVCARFFRRADGTILTKDCPVGLAAARKRVLVAASRVAAAIGLAVLAGAAARAAESTSWGNWGWSMRITNVAPLDRAIARVQSWLVTPGSRIDYMGDVALPGGPLPPASGLGQYPVGPHELEHKQ